MATRVPPRPPPFAEPIVHETAATKEDRRLWSESMAKKCMLCGRRPGTRVRLDVDHILSGSKRSNHRANYLLLCSGIAHADGSPACHKAKHEQIGELAALPTLLAAKYLCDREHWDEQLLRGWYGRELPDEWYFIVTLIKSQRDVFPF